MKTALIIFSSIFIALALLPAPASASGPVGFALLVGSNRQGQGQERLKFAKNDALLMKSVLTELGKYSPENVEVLVDPKGEELTRTIGEFEKALAEHAARDEQTVFLFYYSGHARSGGLNLGPEEISLQTLRAHIEKLPATVTLIILDACQSGAISGVKGIKPAADFSFNSVEQLNTEGIAVMASSTSSELSQESQNLKGSFFTHHLTVGLRGAADADRDGMVTLSEAYDYAYNTTLRSTAATAVGKQHATLETDLKGKGDMVLTWPKEFSSKVVLPAKLSGEVLVTNTASNTVMAEIHKAEGENLSVALPPGKYEALIKVKEDEGLKCSITLSSTNATTLNIEGCEKTVIEKEPPKGVDLEGYVKARPERKEHVFAEVAFGWLNAKNSDYTDRLEDFRYESADSDGNLIGKAGLAVTILKYLSLSLAYSTLDDRSVNRNLYSGDGNQVKWKTRRLGLYARGQIPARNGTITPYLQVGGGWAWTKTSFDIDSPDGDADETSHGYHLAGAIGVQLNPWKYVGFTLFEFEYAYAPTLKNELDDVHDSGGAVFMTGLRVGF